MEVKESPSTSLPSEQLESALFFIYDVFDRLTCPFFPMGKTAWQIKHNEHLKGEKLNFGIRLNDFKGAESMFPTAVQIAGGKDIDIRDKKIHIEYNGVPMEIRIITKHYRVLDFLDPVFYAYETFYLPNPFDHFWRMSSFMH